MTDDEALISFAKDKFNECRDNFYVTCTHFFSAVKLTMLLPHFSKSQNDVMVYAFGGYENAERAMLIFAPKMIYSSLNDILEADMLPIKAIKLQKDKFSTLSHRDYLGSIMALGIKRESVGDILLQDFGCFVICEERTAKYIADTLSNVGKGSVKAEICELTDLLHTKESFEEKHISVSSLRLDNVLAAAFSLSRSAAQSKIEAGFVYVDDVAVYKPDFKMENATKVTLRGSGMIKLIGENGIGRRGKLHLNIRRYK